MVNSTCAICHNTWKNLNVKFFSVPKDEIRRARWNESCGFDLKLNGKVCEKHFLMRDYIHYPEDSGNKKARLMPSAVPSVFSIAPAEKTIMLPGTSKSYLRKLAFNDWRLWCRLCAKADRLGNKSVFFKSEPEESVEEGSAKPNLTAAIEKYFNVNMQCDEEFPDMLCTECFSLITSMVNFEDRVSKVQEMFATIQSACVKTNWDLHTIRLTYGLLDKDRDHVLLNRPSQEVLYIDTEPKMENKIFENDESSINPLEQSILSPQIKDANVFDEKEISKNDDEGNHSNSGCDEENIMDEVYLDDNICDVVKNGDVVNSDQIFMSNEVYIDEADNVGDEVYIEEDLGTEILSNSADEHEIDVNQNGIKTTRPDSAIGFDDGTNCTNTIKRRKLNTEADNNVEDSKYIFPCTDCPRKFQYSYFLRQHLERVHFKRQTLEELPCSQCTRVFATQEELKKHKKSHLPLKLRKVSPCPHCDKKFTVDSLRTHIKCVHMNVRPFVCEECGVAVHTTGSLKKHMLTHTDYAPFECEVCKRGFKDAERLKKHMETHDPSKHICPECGLQLNSRATLYKHLVVHRDEKLHKCDYCGRAFKRSKELKSHLIIHAGLKPYSCNFCERTFANANNCRGHKRKLHPKELAALEAAGGGKTYTLNIPKLEELKALTKVAGNLTPVGKKPGGRLLNDPNNLTCQECGTQLKSRSSFYQHLAVHSEVKRHVCDYCGRGFKQSRALKCHLIIHAGLRPYVCNFCGRSFANGSTCRGHKKRIHPEELAALEAEGGGKTITPNIPHIKDLKKALSKAAGKLMPVKSKQRNGTLPEKKPTIIQKEEENKDVDMLSNSEYCSDEEIN